MYVSKNTKHKFNEQGQDLYLVSLGAMMKCKPVRRFPLCDRLRLPFPSSPSMAANTARASLRQTSSSSLSIAVLSVHGTLPYAYL